MASHARTATKEDAADARAKKIKLSVAITLLVVAAGIFIYQVTRTTPAEMAANSRMLQCESTKNVFPHDLEVGEIQPVKCDICGKNDAYSPEKCFWTKTADGKWAIKETPTYVIIPRKIDPENGASSIACPDCGREVVGHNPKPDQADVDRANAGG